MRKSLFPTIPRRGYSRTLYVAYGSNMNIEQMNWRCPSAKVVGTGALKGYQLTFRGGRDSAVATVEPDPEGVVPVVLWSITPDDEAALDRYEGWPTFYRKARVNVDFDGKSVSAMVYIMNDGHPRGKPGAYYYSVILDGYKANGLDVEYLRAAVDGKLGARPELATQPPGRKFNADRFHKIVRMHDRAQMSFRQVGAELGISRQRAHEIYHAGKNRAG